MTNDFDALRLEWQQATGNLPWGVQRVFRDVFQLAADQKTPTPLVWGRDYGDGGACLVNQGAQFLALINGEGGEGKPSVAFGEVVGLFDRINREFLKADVNVDQTVSPLAADILLQWFAPLRDRPIDSMVDEALSAEVFASSGELPYTEPSDEDLARGLIEFLCSPPSAIESDATEASLPVGNPFVD